VLRFPRNLLDLFRNALLSSAQAVPDTWWTTVDVGLSAAETYSTDAALASDPAWLLRGHAPDPARPRNPHPEPIPPSDLRSDSNAPTSQRPVDPSLPDHLP
jgi:hypothetical protein